ncbi:MAG: LysM peptidoglycan-binding domain-containing protein [Actinomycetaceae bacterium]|nr:LysM peptidoglycan-binding domain-containing protein [Actinomycetaceae bacterium]
MSSFRTGLNQYGFLATTVLLTALLLWISVELLSQSRRTLAWLSSTPAALLTSSPPATSTLWNPIVAIFSFGAAIITAWTAASLIATEVVLYRYRHHRRTESLSLLASRALSPLARPLIRRRISTLVAAMTLCTASPTIASEIPDDLSWAAPATTSTATPNREITSAAPVEALSPEENAIRGLQVADDHNVSAHRYIVQSGDCLWSIAAQQLKTSDAAAIDTYWRSIYDRNRESIGDSPHLILPGQELELPERGNS